MFSDSTTDAIQVLPCPSLRALYHYARNFRDRLVAYGNAHTVLTLPDRVSCTFVVSDGSETTAKVFQPVCWYPYEQYVDHSLTAECGVGVFITMHIHNTRQRSIIWEPEMQSSRDQNNDNMGGFEHLRAA